MSGRNGNANAAASSSMNLHCMLCNRNFSDHSHLLTHLGSKGHLTKSHEVNIKANSDPVAARLLHDFDRWYNRNGLGEHIKVRFDQKEKKKANAAKEKTSKGPSRPGSGVATPGSIGSARNTPVPSYPIMQPNYRSQSLRESTLDPQLGPFIKTEPMSRSTTPNLLFHAAPYTANPMARQYALPMMDSPNTPYSAQSQRRVPSILDSVNTPSSSDEEYYEPTPRGPKRGTKRHLSISTNNSSSNYPLNNGIGPNNPGEVPWEPIPETIKDPNSKVDWVMIFDIQNAEGRKNRNQKKSVQVLGTLMRNSSMSHPNEVVFKDGTERTTRVITGVPNSDGDRISGESSPEPELAEPPKKKGGRRPKKAMAQQNVNTGRRDSHQSSFSARPRRTPYYTNSSDNDDSATYGRAPPRRQAGVRIHRDNSGPAITFNGTSNMSPPLMPPMSVLTSGLTQLAPHSSYQQRASASLQHSSSFGCSQQTFTFGSDTMRPSNMHVQLPTNGSNVFAPMNYQSHNFGSFGGLNNASMTGTFGGSGNPLFGRGSHGVTSAMQHQRPQYVPNSATNFHGAGVPDISSIDNFPFGNLPMSPTGSGFDANSMSGAGNGLFFDGNAAADKDDGATISLPNSEI